MSSWSFSLVNTTCSSTALQLSKVEQPEADQQTISSFPDIAKIIIGDIEYNFELNTKNTDQNELSHDEDLGSTSDLAQILTFEPALTLQDNKYSASIVLQTASETVSGATEIELQGCAGSEAKPESQEEGSSAENAEAQSTEDSQTDSETSTEEVSQVTQTDSEGATQTLDEFSETVTPTWSVEDLIQSTSALEPTLQPTGSIMPESTNLESAAEEKKTVESGATAGGLILFLLIVALTGALYYRSRMQKQRREQSALMRDVWRSDMQEA